jgi:hypothetical protein
MASLDDLVNAPQDILSQFEESTKFFDELKVRQKASLGKRMKSEMDRFVAIQEKIAESLSKGNSTLEKIPASLQKELESFSVSMESIVQDARQMEIENQGARANQPHANPDSSYTARRMPREQGIQELPSSRRFRANLPDAHDVPDISLRLGGVNRARAMAMAEGNHHTQQGGLGSRIGNVLMSPFPEMGRNSLGNTFNKFFGIGASPEDRERHGSFMSNMFFHGGGMRGFAMAGLGNLAGSQPIASGVNMGFNAIISSAEKLAATMEVMNDGSKTSAQKFDEMGKLVGGPVYQAFMSLRDAAMGVQEGLRRNRVHHERQAIVAETSNRIADTRGQMERDGVMPRARAANPLQLPVWEGAQFDRTRADQDNDYREYSMRYEARSQFARSGQNLAAANSAVAEQEARVRRQQQAVAASEAWASSGFGRMNRTRGAETNPLNRNRVGVDDAGRESEYRQNETLRERRRLEQEILALNAARTNQIQAQAQHETNRINLLRTEVEILRNREQAMGQASRRLGAMSNSEISTSRSQREYVRRHLAEGGDIGDLPSDLVAGAGRISPREIGRYQEERGERIGREEMQGDTRNREDAWMFEGGETRRQLQIRLEQMTAQVNVAVQLNENTLAQRIAQEVGPAIARLVNVIRSQVGNRLNSYESGQVVRNNNQ